MDTTTLAQFQEPILQFIALLEAWRIDQVQIYNEWGDGTVRPSDYRFEAEARAKLAAFLAAYGATTTVDLPIPVYTLSATDEWK